MIASSVGKGGANRRDDTRAIQGLLGDLQIATGTIPLAIDGIVGPKTIAAIVAFQQQNLGLPVDGRIDPGGPTMSGLDEKCAYLYATLIFNQATPLFRYIVISDNTPLAAVHQYQELRTVTLALEPTAPTPGAARLNAPPLNVNLALMLLRFQNTLLAAVQAIPLILILLVVLMLLYVVTSNPIWQRAAKDFVQGLRERIKLLSQKIRDAVKDIVDAIEGVLEGTVCADLCASEIAKVKDLARQINELLDNMPANDNDPEALKRLKFQLARLYEQILNAQQAVVDCLERNGC
ncbi:MAG: peptidoglycan-binding protein [Verrucomicrobia bacterium]|nr:peptidoglycan-binding protein [Verrucomicrobiota bacterium]